MLGDIADMKVDGDNVVVTLNNANADLPLLLTDYHLVIQPNGGMDNPARRHRHRPLQDRGRRAGRAPPPTKYDDHWRDDVGFVDSIEILVMNDTTARLSALQSGQVHIINRVEPKTVSLLRGRADVVIERVPSRRPLRLHHALQHARPSTTTTCAWR